MRYMLVGVCLAVMVSGCGGDEMSLTEYVDGLNAIEARATPQVEVLWVEYQQIATPSDVTTLLERMTAIRIEEVEASEALDPPEQIADLHYLTFDWQATMIPVEEALAARADTVADWEEFSQSTEVAAYRAALADGSTVCGEFQAKLDATAERGVFADVPWILAEMKEVVEAVLGCDTFPENPEELFSAPPTTSSP
jgi:hypothetical protein